MHWPSKSPHEYISLALCSTVFLSALILSSTPSFADDSIVSDVSVTVPVSCNLSSTLDTAHTATINPGQSQSDIGTTTFKIICNDNSGYAIYAIGYSNEEYGNTKLLATIGGQLSPTHDINTGTETSGNTSAWAMKLMPVTGTYAPTIESDTNGSFASYHIVPDTYTKVATFTSNTDAVIGSSVQSTYRAYIDSNKPAGTYAGKVRYSLVHPNDAAAPAQPVDTPAGYISYNPNASGVTDTMGDQSIESTDTEANLWASNFQRPGYGFAGWSETHDYSDPTKFHGPNETISFTAGQYSGQNKGLSLYAIWVKSTGSIQGWTGCSSLASGTVTALTDQRDNNTYAVAKLADGKCWMIENLRLDNDATGNSDGSLAQGYNPSFIGLANPETADFTSNSDTANSLYSTDGSTAAPAITGNYRSSRFPRYNNQNTASPATNMIAWDNNANTYSVGNWYTWSAAIADTTNYYDADNNHHTITGTSICPSGWHLPSGGDKNNFASSEFWTLSRATIGADPANYESSTTPYYTGTPEASNASNILRSYPNNFIYSGHFGPSSPYGNSSSPSSRGFHGSYWSSSMGVSSNGYSLYFSSNIIYAGDYSYGKYHGYSIRCMSGS